MGGLGVRRGGRGRKWTVGREIEEGRSNKTNNWRWAACFMLPYATQTRRIRFHSPRHCILSCSVFLGLGFYSGLLGTQSRPLFPFSGFRFPYKKRILFISGLLLGLVSVVGGKGPASNAGVPHFGRNRPRHEGGDLASPSQRRAPLGFSCLRVQGVSGLGFLGLVPPSPIVAHGFVSRLSRKVVHWVVASMVILTVKEGLASLLKPHF